MVGTLVLGALTGCGSKSDDPSPDKKPEKSMSTTKNMDQDSQKMDKESTDKDSMDKKDAADGAMKNSGYITYQDYQKDPSRYAKGKTVLFFNASWCPSCKEADDQFKSEEKEIPKDVTVVSVDYDQNASLRQKYGVTIQDTFVQIDKDGKQLKKWAGGGLDRLKQQL